MLAIDMTTSPAAATFEIALHTFISRSIHAMRKSTIPRSALAEPLRYAQSAWLGRVPMGCGPAYAAVTPLDGNRGPARHLPPLGETVATTTGAGVLRLKHGMPTHRRLLAIVRRVRGREARSDEVLAMGADRLHPLLGNVLPIRFREVEATPELRLPKPRESRIIAVYQISTHVGS